uniref:B30.2/SPRY domain-containing protein n=1 Tax=Periophthalmus magnuspinnatus TaxID=409849 RepID=A0A3B4AM23_9GOBI
MDSSSDSSSYNMEPPGPGPGSKPRPKPAPSSLSLKSDHSNDHPLSLERLFLKTRGHLQQRFSRVFEGVAKAGDSAPLTQIYTELYITEGRASEVNQEHEVRHMETASRRPASPETTITCEDLFKGCPHSQEPIRVVLTKGVAGVGKTILTQKFCLDWAEGRANQEIELLFPFTVRELNVLRDRSMTLMQLIHHFFPETREAFINRFDDFKAVWTCRLPLDFSRTQVLTDPSESTSVHVLLVNLIRGTLLPSAHLWITMCPAAVNQIPAEYISMVTEVRGFADLQKEQYFRKRFRDQATAVISHIKSIRSRHMMCHIPIFCWILSTVIQKLLEQTEKPELPRTLTQMYVHFLVVQAKVQNIKYHQRSGEDLHWTPETREMVKSLGKLAFEQLQKGNLIFYECDLSECGLDAAEASVYSGKKTELSFLHCPAVDQALQSQNGHLDLFLRFLLGLSLPTNQRLLQGLLTQTGSDQTNQETVKHLKQKLNEKRLSAERSLNLLHCLIELNDHSLVEQIQRYMRKGHISKLNSPAQWSALSFLLLSSDSDLEKFDLRKYCSSETALLGLLCLISFLSSSSLTHLDLSHNNLQGSGVELLCSGLKSTTSKLETLRLSGCLVSERGGAALASALGSASSHLRELDLSYNHPGPSAALYGTTPTAPCSLSGVGPGSWMVPGLRKYSGEFSLDPNTAHRKLKLSENTRTVTCVREEQQYSDHEDRFTDYRQVLSCTGLRGRCYWEVDWRGEVVDISVSNKGIRRRGEREECGFKNNDQSWSLMVYYGHYHFCHNNRCTNLSSSSFSFSLRRRVSVFLDSEAGSLSFYDIHSDGELFHLHTFSHTFTEPLFPGFGFGEWKKSSSVSVVDLSRVLPGGQK